MKTKLIPTLLAAATLTSAIAQSSTSATPKASGASTSSGAGYGTSGRTRSTTLDGQNAYGAASSGARYRTRLDGIVRRANTAVGAGSIILTTPIEPQKVDELTEDLNVLTLIINRNLDRVFGEKETQYRLGVPITMGRNRSIEASYIQDFGVVFKLHVPFPVATAGPREKKPEPAAAPDNEWEKARRTLYAGDEAAGIQRTGTEEGAAMTPAYDEKLVNDLKKEILDALKNISNVRHMAATESATVAILGSAESAPTTIDPLTGIPTASEPTRPTILTIRVRKADVGENLAEKAKVTSYFDTASSGAPSAGFGGGYGGGGSFGSGYSYETVPGPRR
jgi:hypothetical protein